MVMPYTYRHYYRQMYFLYTKRTIIITKKLLNMFREYYLIHFYYVYIIKVAI